MEREIKFEYGFESVNGIVKKSYALSEIPNIKEKCDVWNDLPIVYVRQFTGLKDKNGKEIYHKDRIRFTINFSDENARAYWSEDCFIGEVYWKDYGWSVNNISFEKMYDQDYVFRMQDRDFDKRLLDRYSKIRVCEFNEISNIEVIGNIYENPELIN